MNTKKNTSQTGDDAEYTPNWINMGGSPGDDELPLGDEDLYPELDPNEDIDYKNRAKMRQ